MISHDSKDGSTIPHSSRTQYVLDNKICCISSAVVIMLSNIKYTRVHLYADDIKKEKKSETRKVTAPSGDNKNTNWALGNAAAIFTTYYITSNVICSYNL